MIRTEVESVPPQKFKPGDRVMLKRIRFEIKKLKRQTEWTGPFEILSIGPDGYAKVRGVNKRMLYAKLDRMKPTEVESAYRYPEDALQP